MATQSEQPECSPARIQLFLGDQLTGVELQSFEEHLGQCAACRTQLETKSADISWWNEARSYLSKDGPEDWPARANHTEYAEACFPLQHVEFLAPSDDPRMLGRLGTYEIAGVIGYGGMGIVLKGLDPALSRYVAIKVLAPQLATSAGARRRFAREAQAAAAVVHENVIEIHGVAEWNQLPYLVMPYVRGPSLQKRLDDSGPFELSQILRIGLQTAAGLSAAHAQGLVHRDVKPANILLSDGVERVKLTDFGLARAADDASLTRTGVIAGTPQYMSPEQARGDRVDHRSDLFSLGSVLYTLCTGRTPFRAETSYGVLRRICESAARPIREINPEIPRWLEAIIERLHQKDPQKRFQTAAELAELLQGCLAHIQQPKQVELPVMLRKLEQKRRPIPAKFLIAIALAVVMGLSVLLGPLIVYVGLGNRSGPMHEVTAVEPISAAEETPRDTAPDGAHAWEDGLSEELSTLAEELTILENQLP